MSLGRWLGLFSHAGRLCTQKSGTVLPLLQLLLLLLLLQHCRRVGLSNTPSTLVQLLHRCIKRGCANAVAGRHLADAALGKLHRLRAGSGGGRHDSYRGAPGCRLWHVLRQCQPLRQSVRRRNHVCAFPLRGGCRWRGR